MVQGFALSDDRNVAARHARDADWPRTPLGPVSDWSGALKANFDLVMNSPLPSILLWGKDHISFCNDAFLDILGRRKSEVPIRSLPAMPALWSSLAEWAELASKGEPQIVFDLKLIAGNAEVQNNQYFDTQFIPVWENTQKKPAGLIIHFCETTARFLQLSSRDTEQKRLAELFDASPFFLAVGSADEFRFKYANKSFARLVQQQDFVGKTIEEVIPDAVDQGLMTLLEHIRATGESVSGRDVPLSVETGQGKISHRYIDFVYEPLFGGDGKVQGIIASGYDVSEEHAAKLAAAVIEAQLRTSKQLAMIGTVSATLAHELNQPLAAAANYLSAARRALAGKGLTDHELNGIDAAENEIQRAGNIIRGMRSLAGERMMKREPRAALKLIKSAIATIRAAGIPAGIDLQTDLSLQDETVTVDSVQCEQVLINLIRNAIDSSIEAGEVGVCVRARVASESVFITVVDDGKGFNPSLIEKGPTLGQSTTGGLGLGLSICRTIVEAHGGRLTLTNRSNGGAIAAFTIPTSTR